MGLPWFCSHSSRVLLWWSICNKLVISHVILTLLFFRLPSRVLHQGFVPYVKCLFCFWCFGLWFCVPHILFLCVVVLVLRLHLCNFGAFRKSSFTLVNFIFFTSFLFFLWEVYYISSQFMLGCFERCQVQI